MPRDLAIATARTILRPFIEADTDELVSVFHDPMVRRYLLDDQVMPVDWVKSEIAASRARFERDGTGLWALRLARQPAIIGFTGFREFFEPPQLQLLYGLLPQFWGRGLATETAAAVCDHAFRALRFEQIKAATDTANHASARVLLRLGMRPMRTTPEASGGTTFYVLERAAVPAAAR
jgi:[ribosomal protein S5]-alanine N-acetyltransferase